MEPGRHRVVHTEPGVFVTMSGKPLKQSEIDENQLLKLLAQDYSGNLGLHMSRADLKAYFDVADKTLDEVLVGLEQKKWVKVYRGRKGVELVEATFERLKRANPFIYYQLYPSWVNTKTYSKKVRSENLNRILKAKRPILSAILMGRCCFPFRFSEINHFSSQEYLSFYYRSNLDCG